MDDHEESACDIRVGTSGYDYLEWRGGFYPEELPRKEFLRFYSGIFRTVELNYTYYRQPNAESMATLARQTPATLDFSVKANQSLTHEVNEGSVGEDIKAFRQGIEPLHKAGRLCAVLMSFPFSFHYRPPERTYLSWLLGELEDLPLVVEFRSIDWYTARVIDGLKERRVGICTVDEPLLPGLPPVSDLVTSDLAYIRFHGRNVETWWSGDSATRYDYLYSESELKGWKPRIGAMMEQAKKLRVFFNNHRSGQATTNARDLQRLLTEV